MSIVNELKQLEENERRQTAAVEAARQDELLNTYVEQLLSESPDLQVVREVASALDKSTTAIENDVAALKAWNQHHEEFIPAHESAMDECNKATTHLEKMRKKLAEAEQRWHLARSAKHVADMKLEKLAKIAMKSSLFDCSDRRNVVSRHPSIIQTG